MSIINKLQAEIKRLNEEKLQTEKDMEVVTRNFKEAWDHIGIDFSKMATDKETGDKPSAIAMTKIVLSIGKRFLSRQVKIDFLINKWETVSPVLEKYKHVLKSVDAAEPKKLD